MSGAIIAFTGVKWINFVERSIGVQIFQVILFQFFILLTCICFDLFTIKKDLVNLLDLLTIYLDILVDLLCCTRGIFSLCWTSAVGIQSYVVQVALLNPLLMLLLFLEGNMLLVIKLWVYNAIPLTTNSKIILSLIGFRHLLFL
jgi:hypothetical protein